MYQIEDKAQFIDFILEDLKERIFNTKPEEFEIEFIKAEVESLLYDILDLEEQICISSEKFKYKFDYWSSCHIDTCCHSLNEILEILAKNKMNSEVFEIIEDKINYAYIIWNNKFLDDFGCWFDGLTSSGLYLNQDAVVYTKDSIAEAFVQMLQNALRAERLYFSFARNKNQAALTPIKQDFSFNRRHNGATREIDAQQLSGRRLITLNIAAIEDDVNNAQPAKLANSTLISQTLYWHRVGNKNWNRETVVRGYINYNGAQNPLKIKYQFTPLPGQLANMHTSGVGRYGTSYSGRIPNILELINQLTHQEPAKEQEIAKLLLRYKHGDGSALSETALQDAGLYLPIDVKKRRTLVQQFNKAAYLICFQEVYRRKNQGYRMAAAGQTKKVVELPFGIAVACVLKLIKDGHLRLADVLDTDSLYGVFTGTGVMSDNLLRTIQKFNVLFALFVEKYANDNYQLFEYSEKEDEFNVVFTPQFFHKILREVDGDGSDSDNEDYGFTEKKSAEIEQLQETMANLNLSPLKFKAS